MNVQRVQSCTPSFIAGEMLAECKGGQGEFGHSNRPREVAEGHRDLRGKANTLFKLHRLEHWLQWYDKAEDASLLRAGFSTGFGICERAPYGGERQTGKGGLGRQYGGPI